VEVEVNVNRGRCGRRGGGGGGGGGGCGGGGCERCADTSDGSWMASVDAVHGGRSEHVRGGTEAQQRRVISRKSMTPPRARTVRTTGGMRHAACGMTAI
jgi:hypothetical protein